MAKIHVIWYLCLGFRVLGPEWVLCCNAGRGWYFSGSKRGRSNAEPRLLRCSPPAETPDNKWERTRRLWMIFHIVIPCCRFETDASLFFVSIAGLTFSSSARKLSRVSSDSLPTSNMVTAWLFRFWLKANVTDESRRLLYIDASVMENWPLTGDRFPIMRKAVRVESKRKAILFVGAAGMLRLLTLPVSAAETLLYLNVAR